MIYFFFTYIQCIFSRVVFRQRLRLTAVRYNKRVLDECRLCTYTRTVYVPKRGTALTYSTPLQ